jgi:hypothetical protein
MSVLPARGFWRRLKGRLILRRHPNYQQFKRHLVGLWSGK